MRFLKSRKKAANSPEDLENTQKESAKKRSATKIFVIVVLLIATVLLVAYYVSQKNKKESSQKSGVVCSDTINSKAATLFSEKKFNEINTLVDEIKSKQGFDKDVNCLYIVTKKYVDDGDVKNARKYYDLLVVAYNPAVGYSVSLGKDTSVPSRFKGYIEFLESPSQENEEPLIFGDQPQ